MTLEAMRYRGYVVGVDRMGTMCGQRISNALCTCSERHHRGWVWQ